MKFINMTPHEVVVRKPDGEEVKISPSGRTLRLREVDQVLEDANGNPITVDGIPVVHRVLLPPEELPEEFNDPDAVVIVSLPALMGLVALREAGSIRPLCWIVAPDTGTGAIRDERGQIVGTTRFITM